MKRIGFLIPPANARCETEFPFCMPAGFTAHFTRLVRPHATLTESSLIEMKESAFDAADRMTWLQPVVLAYACTSGSFLSGSHLHDGIASRLHDRTGIPVVTTATAVLASLNSLSANRVGVVTPYPPSITSSAVELLTDNGITVAMLDSYGYELSRDILAIEPESIASRVRNLYAKSDGLDAVFISCTNVATFPVIERLEEEIGIPVVSSNSATLSAALRLAGYAEPIPGLGRVGQLPLSSA